MLTAFVFFMPFGAAYASEADDLLGQNIDAFLSAGEKNGFSGALLVAKKGKIIFNKAYGKARRSEGLDNGPTTVFDIGSVTKQITGAAILKLVEAGKIKLDDGLEVYFQNLPEDKKNITIHQLLTHTAGLVDGIGKGDFDHIETDQFFRQVFATTLIHKPGSKFRYSNAGYSILARIIELVSGMEYEAFLDQYLFKPAGMKDTGYLLPPWKDKVFAKGYQQEVIDIGSMAERYRREGRISWVLKGNGGINSTQMDMYKWYRALKENTVLSREMTEKFTAPHVKENEEGSSHYAYGWAIFQTDRNTKMVAHNGSNGVFFHDFMWLPDEDVVIIFSTNALTRQLYGVAWQVERMIFDKAYEPKPLVQDLGAELLRYTEAYTGNVEDLSAQMAEKFATRIDREYYLNGLGGFYLRGNDYKKAIQVFKLNVQIFPDDGNLWDSLGEGYFAAGQKHKARESFEKALALRPEGRCHWCENSGEKLKQLK